MTLNDYLDLITSEHRSRRKFGGTVTTAVAPLVTVQDFIDSTMLPAWDIDTAVGAQLDQIGEWVGVTRSVELPLTGAYFSWDRTKDLGWEHGYWQGKYDPSTGIISLADHVYRAVLFAKIASNVWDGTMSTMSNIWDDTMGTMSKLIIMDHQDMSITLGLKGIAPNAVMTYVLISGRIPLKPEGVRIRKYVIAKRQIFGFDIANDAIQGFDVGEWGTEIAK